MNAPFSGPEKDRLLNVIQHFSSVPLAAICMEHDLERLGLDSLDRVELVLAIEDEFGSALQLTAEEQDQLAAPTTTVQQLLNFVDRRMFAAGAPLTR